MKSNHILKAALLAICFTAIASCVQTNTKSSLKTKPNIIYVLTDDLGYGDITAFNPNSKIKTPHLDQMANEGMMFTDAHTSSSVCTPTRYGILTGRYNWRTRLKQGVLGGYSEALIDTNRETVASLLKKYGYYTAFIGKWHLGWNWAKNSSKKEDINFSKPITHSPNDNGFDYAYGHCGSLDMPPYVYVENEKATLIPADTTKGSEWKHETPGIWRKGITAADFKHKEVTPHFFKKAIKLIGERANEKQPFFLYLPLPSPHTPILPTKEWQGKSNLNPYGDFVMMVDNYMGQLTQAVKDAGMEKNTLIVFTSDNGCSPWADFETLKKKGHFPSGKYRGHKADIFEGGHRVPFIVKWPEVIKPKSVCEQTICTTDFMATCAAIIDAPLADNSAEDSFNMLPLLKNAKSKEFKREATVHHSINGSFAIRKGDWKFIFCKDSGGWSFPRPKKDKFEGPEFQLYNLKNDPAEKDNLYGKHPEVEAELKQLMAKYIKDGRSTEGEKQQNAHPSDNPKKKWSQTQWMKQL